MGFLKKKLNLLKKQSENNIQLDVNNVTSPSPTIPPMFFNRNAHHYFDSLWEPNHIFNDVLYACDVKETNQLPLNPLNLFSKKTYACKLKPIRLKSLRMFPVEDIQKINFFTSKPIESATSAFYSLSSTKRSMMSSIGTKTKDITLNTAAVSKILFPSILTDPTPISKYQTIGDSQQTILPSSSSSFSFYLDNNNHLDNVYIQYSFVIALIVLLLLFLRYLLNLISNRQVKQLLHVIPMESEIRSVSCKPFYSSHYISKNNSCKEAFVNDDVYSMVYPDNIIKLTKSNAHKLISPSKCLAATAAAAATTTTTTHLSPMIITETKGMIDESSPDKMNKKYIRQTLLNNTVSINTNCFSRNLRVVSPVTSSSSHKKLKYANHRYLTTDIDISDITLLPSPSSTINSSAKRKQSQHKQ